MTDSSQPQPFDERSALEELEQLADKIQLSRRQRAQAVAEFDAFVRTFREDRHAAANAALAREERRADDRSAAVGAATHASRALTPAPDVSIAPAVAPAPASVPESAPWAVPVPRDSIAQPVSRWPRAPYIGVALAAVAVVVVGVLLWRSATPTEGPAAQSVSSGAGTAATAPASTVASAPAVVLPTAPAEPPRALNIEIITIRPVWTRVTVDGRRALARLIAAEERLSFGADQAIAIRAGDAGAFRLVVDGHDQGVLGKDGQIFEKSFSATTPAR